MKTDEHYQKSLIFLSYLIINADGVLEQSEIDALRKICQFENIDEEVLDSFLKDVKGYSERQIYEMSIDEILKCSEEDRIKSFAWLYRISEADGKVHAKEVRFLLYATKLLGVDFDDVVNYAQKYPSLQVPGLK